MKNVIHRIAIIIACTIGITCFAQTIASPDTTASVQKDSMIVATSPSTGFQLLSPTDIKITDDFVANIAIGVGIEDKTELVKIANKAGRGYTIASPEQEKTIISTLGEKYLSETVARLKESSKNPSIAYVAIVAKSMPTQVTMTKALPDAGNTAQSGG